jgi:glycosyltransferase involved in cell wall biosynthesis
VIAAGLAQRPDVGGHTWFALQYLLGFRRLGWDVLLVDRLDPTMSENPTANLDFLADVFEAFGLADCWTVLLPDGDAAGIPRVEVERRMADSDLLINVMGYLDDEHLLGLPPLRVFLDIDPGFGQMWRELQLHDLLAGHDRFASVGLNVGTPACTVPDCGQTWIPTLPPVVLDAWPPAAGGEAFTTVASWRGPFDAVEYDGQRYGLRAHEFRRFLELPERTSAKLELALAIDDADVLDRKRLTAHGWSLVDPLAVAGDPFSYNRFIRRSGAEFTVAKGMYVDTGSGWFSDRSACYLASGKPVIAQDTGFAEHLPTGDGLISFTTLDEAAAAVEEVRANPVRHRRAAREIAEEHFDSRRVLRRLIDELDRVPNGG